jgi:hypothetical protein
MHIDNGFVALKSFEDWLQDRVSEVHARGIREENTAIEPDDVECVRQLLQGASTSGKGGRQAKPPNRSGLAVNEFGREFVAAARPKPAPWRYLPCSRRAHSVTQRKRRWRRHP